jgi:hypothetical protein
MPRTREPSMTILRACLLLLLVSALATAAMAGIWGPVLGNATTSSIQIAWRDGDVPSQGITFQGTLLAGTADGSYRLVTLQDLKPDTAYSYTFDRAGTPVVYAFRTAPAAAAAVTFGVIGDTRTQVEIHRSVAQKVLTFAPRFLINTGDLVADGRKPEEWDTFFDIEGALAATLPYLAAAGNHEQNADPLFRLFPGAGETARDHYAVTYGCVRVIVLNSTRDVPGQAEWLEKTLAEKTPAAWTVAVFHYPPFTSSPRGPVKEVAERWVPILEAHKVAAVFLGHDHFYERSEHNGVQYIIAGGGGAPLYPAKDGANPFSKVFYKEHHYLRVDAAPTEMRIRMYHMDGTVGDDVLLKKDAPAAAKTTARPAPIATVARWITALARWAFPISPAPAFDRSIIHGPWMGLRS